MGCILIHLYDLVAFPMNTHDAHRIILSEIVAQMVDIYTQGTCIEISIFSPNANKDAIAIYDMIHILA